MNRRNGFPKLSQLLLADPAFAGNVKSFDTRPFWCGGSESPGGGDHYYNGNAETYTLVGDSLGRAMIELIKEEK